MGAQMSKVEDVQLFFNELREKYLSDRLFELGESQETLAYIKINFDNLYKLLDELNSYYVSLPFKDRSNYYEAKRITHEVQDFLDDVRRSAIGDTNKTRQLGAYVQELEMIFNMPVTFTSQPEHEPEEVFSVELAEPRTPRTQSVQVIGDGQAPVFRRSNDGNMDLLQINKKQDFQIRLLTSFLVLLVGLILIYLLPLTFGWAWLADHPNRLGLYGCATVIVLSVSWAIIDKQRKLYALGTLAVGAGLVLLQILGR